MDLGLEPDGTSLVPPPPPPPPPHDTPRAQRPAWCSIMLSHRAAPSCQLPAPSASTPSRRVRRALRPTLQGRRLPPTAFFGGPYRGPCPAMTRLRGKATTWRGPTAAQEARRHGTSQRWRCARHRWHPMLAHHRRRDRAPVASCLLRALTARDPGTTLVCTALARRRC